MSTTPTDYGEPWTYSDTEPALRTASGEPIITGDDYEADEEKLLRAAICTNALAGIPDPEAAIQAAREALEAEEDWRNQRDDTGTLRAIARHKREKALNLLSQKP